MGRAGLFPFCAAPPGLVESQGTDALSEEARAAAMGLIALKRFASVEDIANLAVFLAAEKSSYITGQSMQADGGVAM